jgi:hypothetical protein
MSQLTIKINPAASVHINIAASTLVTHPRSLRDSLFLFGALFQVDTTCLLSHLLTSAIYYGLATPQYNLIALRVVTR